MKPETADFLSAADIALSKARRILAIDIPDEAARHAYFAQFHAAQALIFERVAKVSKSHKGVNTLLHELAKTEPTFPPDFAARLSKAYRYKEIADYETGSGPPITPARAADAIVVAEHFVASVRHALASPPTPYQPSDTAMQFASCRAGSLSGPTMTDIYRLIAQTQAAYARAIDDDRLEEWPAFFADPATYVITTADNHREGLEGGIVACYSHGMLRDRISALREANIYERQHYRHILGSPFIVDEEPHVATGSPQGSRHVQVRSETPFLVVRIMRTGDTSVFATGRYLDVYVIYGGKALLEKRIVVCDSSRIDTLLAIPL